MYPNYIYILTLLDVVLENPENIVKNKSHYMKLVSEVRINLFKP